MRVLIAYASKTGTTGRAARLLAEEFRCADVVDLARKTPDPSRYDVVIIGSAIRFGRILRPVRAFIADDRDGLREKQKALFICNAFLERTPRLLKDNFSVTCRNSSIIVDSFGGEMRTANLRGPEKFFVRMYLEQTRGTRRAISVEPVILTDRIRIFADTVKDAAEPGFPSRYLPGRA